MADAKKRHKVQRAYQAKAMLHHPDRFMADGDEQRRRENEELFKGISSARDFLFENWCV